MLLKMAAGFLAGAVLHFPNAARAEPISLEKAVRRALAIGDWPDHLANAPDTVVGPGTFPAGAST